MDDKEIYVVLTETEYGVDVAGAYDNYDAALLHIQRRFDVELRTYEVLKYDIDRFEEVSRPENGDHGGCIRNNSKDYWVWHIQTVHIEHTCVINDIGGD